MKIDRSPIDLKDFDQFTLAFMMGERCRERAAAGHWHLCHTAARCGLGLNLNAGWNKVFTSWLNCAENEIEKKDG